MDNRRVRHGGIVGLAALATALATCMVAGAVVVPMDLATLADHAGQVIVGEIVEARSYWADDPRRIETELRLTGVTYLKGRLPDADDTFTLVVPGGKVDDVTMRLSGAPEPVVGQTWVLFLLPEYKTHPVVGLWQGAFQASPDEAGVFHVHDAFGRPVTGISEAGNVQVASPPRKSVNEALVSSEGVRIRPAEAETRAATPMTLDAFRAALEPILSRSRDHELEVSAGRRVAANLRAVPLRTTGATSAEGSLRGTDAVEPAPADRKQRRAEP